MGHCIGEFDLISNGDRIMVCLSGGKDSYTLLHLLERARRKAEITFKLIAVHLDQGQPGYDGKPLEDWLRAEGYSYKIIREDTYSIVVDQIPDNKTYCSMCSRLRRGILYKAASQLGCNKLALGHHRDDTIETLMLNMIFSGSMHAMPPKLLSDDGAHTVIRPLLYCAESDIAEFAQQKAFPILPCNLCGSQDNLMRKRVKALLTQIEGFAPEAKNSMLAALRNVKSSHLLDRTLSHTLSHTVVKSGSKKLVNLAVLS